jgi:integrase
MRDGYIIGRYRGEFCAKLFVNGKRVSRVTLGTDNAEEAQRQIRDLNAELIRDALPEVITVDALMDKYIADREAEKKVAVYRMKQCQAILRPHFGALRPEQVDKGLCTKFIEKRQNVNVANTTIRTELAYLSAALQWAVDMKLIAAKPRIWRPSRGRPRSAREDYHLTRAQADRLLAEAKGTPHLWLWIILALGTAGRPLHILQLTWDRVDFHRGFVNLDDPDRDANAKGRARVAMNESVRDALLEARRRATSPYVIEFEGKPIKSIKGALKRAAERAGIEASPYVLRHTAAVWMAEAGVPIPEIGQIMGHSKPEITYKVYARFSPGHQKGAVSKLEVMRSSAGSVEPTTRNVGGTIGPVVISS